MKVLIAMATLMLGCAGRSPGPAQVSAPAFMLGSFVDDYGASYVITPREWRHGSRARYHIVRWDAAGQYLIARNDQNNPGDQGLWTRIDWVELPGMPPWTWAYCHSAYKAPSRSVADTVSVANRATPRTGCNGFPFSRMRIAADSGAAPAALAQPSASPPFRTTGAFVAISVPNLEAARAWYVDTLGLAVALEPPPYQGIRALILEGGGLIVELIHNPAAQARPPVPTATLSHGVVKVGIVVENLDATLQALRARGVPLIFGPFPAQSTQRANFGIRDNAGTIIQFFGAR